MISPANNNTKKTILLRPLDIAVPSHIQRLQTAIQEYDTAIFAKSSAPPFFVRDGIPGEWWPFALGNNHLTLVSRLPSGGTGTAPFSVSGTPSQRICGSEELDWSLVGAVNYWDDWRWEDKDGWLNLDDAPLRQRRWYTHPRNVEGEDKRVLDEAQRMWRQVACLAPADFREYLQDEFLCDVRLYRLRGATEVR